MSGEIIYFDAEIENQSSKEVQMSVRLVQIIEFTAYPRGEKTESRDIVNYDIYKFMNCSIIFNF